MLPLTRTEIIQRVFGGKTLSLAERNAVLKVLKWINRNMSISITPVKEKPHCNKVYNAIINTIRDDYGYDPATVFSKNRKRDYVYTRALAHYTYHLLTGSSLRETAQAFENPKHHATVIHMKDLVISLAETYPEYNRRLNAFIENVNNRLKDMQENG